MTFQIKINKTVNKTYWVELFNAINGIRYHFSELDDHDQVRHLINDWIEKYKLKGDRPNIYWELLPISIILKNH